MSAKLRRLVLPGWRKRHAVPRLAAGLNTSRVPIRDGMRRTGRNRLEYDSNRQRDPGRRMHPDREPALMLVSLDAVKAVEHMRPAGYVDTILGSGVLRVDPDVGEVVDIPDAAYWDLVRTYSPAEFNGRVAMYACGVGCQLKRSLAWWGFRDDGSCGCESYAAMLDAWGPDECWRRLEEIVEHLRGAAAEKGLPFVATAARIMVGRAIEAARKETDHATKAQASADMAGARAR